MIRGALSITAFALAGVLIAGPVQAVPALQLYIEGATYNANTETWVTSSNSFRLWAIGTIGGPGGAGPIMDVRLSAAYNTAESGSISLGSSTTGGVGGFTDPSTPVDVMSNAGGGDGAVPVLGNGADLPAHGIYVPGTSFLEWELGHFDVADSPTGDFKTTVPGPMGTNVAQINVYDVEITGFASGVHFDLYDTIAGGNGATFAPPSHDAGTIPEPGSLVLLGSTLLAGVGYSLRRRRNLSA